MGQTIGTDRLFQDTSEFEQNDRERHHLSFIIDHHRDTLSKIPQLEMIDVTRPHSANGGFFGHNYFHRDPWVSSDIWLSMNLLEPQERGLVRQADGLFWEFPHDYPARLKNIVTP